MNPLRYRYASIRLLLAMEPGHAYTRETEPCRATLSTIQTLERLGLVAWFHPVPDGRQHYHLTEAGELERERLARELPVR